MSHLESLIAEFLEFDDYLVKRNIKVGRLGHGGWEMELDVIGFHPTTKRLVHFEPSIDALSWEKREARYIKKFQAGRKYILENIFPWLPKNTKIEQFAVFISHPEDRNEIAGGRILSIDELLKTIRDKVLERGIVAKNAISEQFPLLRTLQLSHCGYSRVVE